MDHPPDNSINEKRISLFKIIKCHKNEGTEHKIIRPIDNQEINANFQNITIENKVDPNREFLNLLGKDNLQGNLDSSNMVNKDSPQNLDLIKEQKLEKKSPIKNNKENKIKNLNQKNDAKKFCKQMNCPCKLVNNEKSLQIKNSENGDLKSTLIIQKLEENAILFASKNDFSSTINHYEKILILDNDNINALEQIGHLYLLNNNLLKAHEFYFQSLELSKKPNKQILFGLGIIYERNCNFEESLMFYLKSLSFIETNQEKYNLWYKIGEILIKISNFDSAIQIFEFCLQYYDLPNDFKLNILFKLGIANLEKAYEGSINYNRATDYLTKANSLALNIRIDILCYLSWGYFKQKEFDNCDQTLNEISKICPVDPDLLYIKSRLYFEFQNFDEAERTLDKAISINSRNPIYFCTKSIINIKYGKYNEAFRSILTALSIDKNYYEAWYNLGLLYEFFLHSADAIFAYQKVTNICKGFNLAIERIDSLKKNLNIIETKEMILKYYIHSEFRANNSLYPLKGYLIFNKMNEYIQFHLNYPQKGLPLNSEKSYSYYPMIPFPNLNGCLNEIPIIYPDNNSFYFLYPSCENPQSLNYSYPWGYEEKFDNKNPNFEKDYKSYYVQKNNINFNAINDSEIINLKNIENNQAYAFNHPLLNFQNNPFMAQYDQPIKKENQAQNLHANSQFQNIPKIDNISKINNISEIQINTEQLINQDNLSIKQEGIIMNKEIYNPNFINISKFENLGSSNKNIPQNIEDSGSNENLISNEKNNKDIAIHSEVSNVSPKPESNNFIGLEDRKIKQTPEIISNNQNSKLNKKIDLKISTDREKASFQGIEYVDNSIKNEMHQEEESQNKNMRPLTLHRKKPEDDLSNLYDNDQFDRSQKRIKKEVKNDSIIPASINSENPILFIRNLKSKRKRYNKKILNEENNIKE